MYLYVYRCNYNYQNIPAIRKNFPLKQIIFNWNFLSIDLKAIADPIDFDLSLKRKFLSQYSFETDCPNDCFNCNRNSILIFSFSSYVYILSRKLFLSLALLNSKISILNILLLLCYDGSPVHLFISLYSVSLYSIFSVLLFSYFYIVIILVFITFNFIFSNKTLNGSWEDRQLCLHETPADTFHNMWTLNFIYNFI